MSTPLTLPATCAEKSVGSSPFETAFATGPTLSICALTDFLGIREMGILSTVATTCRTLINERLVLLFSQCQETTEEKPRHRTIRNAKIESLMQEAEESVPSTAAKRGAWVAREFFARLLREYPASIPMNGPNSLASFVDAQERADKGLIELFRVSIPRLSPEQVAQIQTQVENMVERSALAELYAALQAGNYMRATEETVQQHTDVWTHPSQQALLRQLPQALFDDRAFSPDLLQSAMFIAGNMMGERESRELIQILDGPENTPEEIAKKAALLRTKTNGMFFLGIPIQLKNKIPFKGKGLQHLPPEILSFRGVFLDFQDGFNEIDLSDNDFRSVPLLPDSATELDLSGNPKLRRFKNLLRLHALQVLNLSGTGVKTVPREVFALPNLTRLNLSGSPLTMTPELAADIAALNARGCEVILTGNPIDPHMEVQE